MQHTKKAKALVDASNGNTNTTTEASSEPNQLHYDGNISFQRDGFEDEERKRKNKLWKGKEKVVTERNEDITTQHNHNQLEIEPRQQNGMRLFPGDPIICQLIQAANLFRKLGLRDILSLALTSQQIFKQLSPLIPDHFLLRYHEKTNIQHYHPKKLLICTSKLDGLFNNPFLFNLREVKFDNECNFEVTELPASVTHLKFGLKFNKKITKLSPNITHLELGLYFDQPISRSGLPVNLTHLTIVGQFNQPVNDLPLNLTHLNLWGDFSQPINELPPKLTHIALGKKFLCYISSLPASVQQVIFCEHYNQPVSHLSKDIRFSTKDFQRWEKFVFVPYQYKPKQSLTWYVKNFIFFFLFCCD
eukprot:TRINITY_DN3938_c0_g1_i17.p1 TRINITY_DN3938_c0_g1~~TRINITY_DN3938_c0_g1_i17.p1  ORF type:complete len:360 (+),score=56.99 TRINITY_DN3938_c0_g1_i17:1279-2358(+)